MKIVIVGCGNVGYHLADLLIKEGHNIVVIDNHLSTLNKRIETLDIMGVYGNGSYYDVQMEADVPNSDLLIAATQRDEVNMLCCLLAKKLGAKSTIARVRDPNYSSQLHLLKEELGLSMAINPELAAAQEIVRLLKFPSAIKIDTLAKGLVELVQFKLTEDNPLVNKELHAISSQYSHNILICAVERDTDVQMPTGSYKLQIGDKVHIIGQSHAITQFFKSIGQFQPKLKNILIVGGGHISYHLAKQILPLGMKVKIIDDNRARCEELCELLPKAEIVYGDGTDQDLLMAEKMDGMDSFIALTGSDEANLIISMFAKSHNIGKVITKINRTNYMDLMQQLGIDSVISQQFITSDTIARYVRAMQNRVGSSVETLYRIINEKAEALEFIANDNTLHLDIPLHKLKLKTNLLIAAIVRDGKLKIPDGNDRIMLNDTVIVVTTNKHLSNLNDIYR